MLRVIAAALLLWVWSVAVIPLIAIGAVIALIVRVSRVSIGIVAAVALVALIVLCSLSAMAQTSSVVLRKSTIRVSGEHRSSGNPDQLCYELGGRTLMVTEE
jgi:hypothetical protein